MTVGGDRGRAAVRLLALPSSVGAARRLVRETLPTTAAFEDLVEAAQLVMSEAVTNAVVHAGTTIDVRVEFTGSGARLEVRDGSGHQPTPRDYAATAGTGRGLMLIDELTTSWGTLPHSDGKTVWFLLDLDSAEDGTVAVSGPAAVPAHLPDAGPDLPADEVSIEGSSVDQGGASADLARHDGTFGVALRQFPVLLYVAWREYAETLLRDFLLARLDIDDDEDAIRVHAESSQALALLVEHIATPPLSDDPGQLLEQATMPSLSVAQIVMRLPPEARALFVTLDQSMEAAGQRSELAASLAAPVQPEMRQFRRWLCGQIDTQAQGLPSTPWSPDPTRFGYRRGRSTRCSGT